MEAAVTMPQPSDNRLASPSPGPTRGQALLGFFMVAALAAGLFASTAMVLACAGPSLCQDGSARSAAGYGLRD